MRNLLSANFYRLVRSKVFYAGLLAAAGVEIYTLLSDYRGILNWKGGLEEAFFFYPMLVVLAMPAFCGIYLGAEYADGTLRSKLAAGIPRWKIYTANLIIAAAVSLALSTVGILAGLALGLPLVGGFHLSAQTLAAYLVCSCVVGVAAASFSTMLALLIPNRAVGLVVGILLTFALLFVGQSLMTTLMEPELVQESTQIVENGQVAYLTEYGAPMVPNPDYIQGISRMLCTFFLYFLPTSQCFTVAFTAMDFPGLLLALGALFTLLTTAVGLGLFVRKDVK